MDQMVSEIFDDEKFREIFCLTDDVTKDFYEFSISFHKGELLITTFQKKSKYFNKRDLICEIFQKKSANLCEQAI